MEREYFLLKTYNLTANDSLHKRVIFSYLWMFTVLHLHHIYPQKLKQNQNSVQGLQTHSTVFAYWQASMADDRDTTQIGRVGSIL